MKTCTRCQETKPETEFHLHVKNSSRRRARCKTCTADLAREQHRRRQVGGLDIGRRRATRPTGKEKTCAKCGETKDTSRFNKDARLRDGLHSYCKDCRSADYQRYLLEGETCTTAPTTPSSPTLSSSAAAI